MSDIEQRLHELLDTPDPLAAWLAGKADDDVVGIAGSPRSCPIATFLQNELESCDFIRVTGDHVFVAASEADEDREVISHRLWAFQFVDIVDDEDGVSDQPITAARARDILAGIEVPS